MCQNVGFVKSVICCCKLNYLNKLAHVQVVINCPYSVAQMCTREDALAYILGTWFIDDVMSYNSLTTMAFN